MMEDDAPSALYAFRLWQWACLAAGVAIAAAGGILAPTAEYGVYTFIYGALLTLLGVIDARRFILPNELNAALLAVGAAMVWRVRDFDWMHHAIGGVVGFSLLFCVEKLYKYFRGRDGLGRGDAKLFGAIGVWVGWTGLPTALLVGSAAGLGFALTKAVSGAKMRDAAMPFGPFLAVGGWVVWLALITGFSV